MVSRASCMELASKVFTRMGHLEKDSPRRLQGSKEKQKKENIHNLFFLGVFASWRWVF